MSKVDICCVGHITRDKVITQTGVRFMPGGTSHYVSCALMSLKADYTVVTKMKASDFEEIKNQYETPRIRFIASKKTTFFENIYGENPDDRVQKVLAKADHFTREDLKGISASWFHLGPLLNNDIPVGVIEMLSRITRISIDAQGFLRKLQGDKVVPCDWKNKDAMLPLIDILKVNEEEATTLSGVVDPFEACRYLGERGIKEVVLTRGGKGSMIWSDGEIIEIDAVVPSRIVDPTGCGDTYMAGYLFKRTKAFSIAESGNFASQLASKKMEDFGAIKTGL